MRFSEGTIKVQRFHRSQYIFEKLDNQIIDPNSDCGQQWWGCKASHSIYLDAQAELSNPIIRELSPWCGRGRRGWWLWWRWQWNDQKIAKSKIRLGQKTFDLTKAKASKFLQRSTIVPDSNVSALFYCFLSTLRNHNKSYLSLKLLRILAIVKKAAGTRFSLLTNIGAWMQKAWALDRYNGPKSSRQLQCCRGALDTPSVLTIKLLMPSHDSRSLPSRKRSISHRLQFPLSDVSFFELSISLIALCHDPRNAGLHSVMSA